MVTNAGDAWSGEGRDGRTAGFTRLLGRSRPAFGFSNPISTQCCKMNFNLSVSCLGLVFCVYINLVFSFTQVQDWKQRALSSESKKNELEEKLSMLYGDLERFRIKQNAVKETKCSSTPLDTQNEFEKRIVVCSTKENSSSVAENRKHREVLRNGERKTHAASARGGLLAPKRSPFRDIGNNSSLLTKHQNGKAVFPLHCHLSSNTEKTYRSKEN